ncbi:TIGR02444 family protein [Marinobacter sp.]|uniref:TIGR02444 family protein n=1 Tax=Marinobacter sp. TaxID=50741 RepID=UPI00385014BD
MTAAELLSKQELQPDSPLWRFAIRLWQHGEISELCLRLQDRGWRVTAVLCASWLASRGQAFDEEPSEVPEWRRQITSPLRAMRKALPKDSGAGAELRASLAQAELEAEKLELALAFAALTHPAPGNIRNTETLAALLERNIRRAAPEDNNNEAGRDYETDRTTEDLVNALCHAMEQHLTTARDSAG